MKPYDIVIIGGGLVGASLAASLQGLPYSVALIESQAVKPLTTPGFDTRSLALSLGSQRILKTIGLWHSIDAHACPIRHIHVSDKGKFGATRLHASQVDVSALGFVVEMHHLNSVLNQALCQQGNLSLFRPAKVVGLEKKDLTTSIEINYDGHSTHIDGRCIVAADGAQSKIRERLGLPVKIDDYQQYAIAANIGLNRNHGHWAYERFTPDGPIALLPMNQQRSSLVYVDNQHNIERLINTDDRSFLHQLHLKFGYRLGRFTQVGKRCAYPLKRFLMPKTIDGNVIFIGNSAHALHPIAGQGFNLGLRDVAELAKLIVQSTRSSSFNALELAASYEQLRAQDQRKVAYMTDTLVRVFASKLSSIRLLADIGLIAFDQVPWLRTRLIKQAMGLSPFCPELSYEMNFDEILAYD